MPINRKMMGKLKQEYGSTKGERVYYAMENAGKIRSPVKDSKPMPIIKNKGSARQPFGKISEPVTKTAKSSNLPLFFGLVFLGAGLILWMRSKGTSFTGPALTVYPSYAADESTIANMMQAVRAIGTAQNLPVGGSGSSDSGAGSTAPPPSGQSGNSSPFDPYPSGYYPPMAHTPYFRDPQVNMPVIPTVTTPTPRTGINSNTQLEAFRSKLNAYLDSRPQLKGMINGTQH